MPCYRNVGSTLRKNARGDVRAECNRHANHEGRDNCHLAAQPPTKTLPISQVFTDSQQVMKNIVACSTVLWILSLAGLSIASESSGFLEEKLSVIDFEISGFHIYWKDRLHLESPEKTLKIRIGGIVQVDSGYIGADSDLRGAFSSLRGYNTDFRRLRLSTFTTLYETVDIKFDIDFARQQEIKDLWVGISNLTVVGQLKLGHMKEPFSLEELTSSTNLIFMERSLPILALSPKRNVGALCQNTDIDNRLTWSLGAFAITGSFANMGNAADRLSHIQGYALTGRITGLPWYGEKGGRLMHVGISYTHQDRDEADKDSRVKLSALPESYLTDQRLVSTPSFYSSGMHIIDPEWAVVLGPLSFQAEYVHTFVSADKEENPDFWGGYVYCSYFLTGEHRTYNMKKGTFGKVKPRNDFRFFGAGLGAWELALRCSYLDLNSGKIQGGKETNLTFGVNWYINEHMRIMLNYIHADIRDCAAPAVNQGNADIYQGRFQIRF